MHVFSKLGDEVIIIYNPRDEDVEVGENLKIFDEARNRGLIVQVIEQNLVDLPGILEDLVRRECLSAVEFLEYAPSETGKYILDVKNMKFARTKIRKEISIQDGKEIISPWAGWVPDRSARIDPIDDRWLLEKLEVGKQYYKHPITIGKTIYTQRPLIISSYHLQGITIIVGKKGTGKSHLAKAILLGLIDHGGKGIVLDINDEYSAMRQNLDGSPSPYHNKLISLDPGVNLRFTLPYIGADVFFDVIQTTMGLPEASAFELRNIWENIQTKGNLSFSNLRDATTTTIDRRILGAIIRRLDRMEQTRLFTDDVRQATQLEQEFNKIPKGGALVINLKLKNKDTMDLVVQTILSKLQELLERGYPPLFIFAEEAHMYLRETDWADAVTRMRHLGTYQIYMTNTPTEMRPLVIRQTDNLCLFHLTENQDLLHVSPAAKIDPETVTQVSKALPFRRCLIVGEVTTNYPFVIDVTPLSVQTAGITRRFFTEP